MKEIKINNLTLCCEETAEGLRVTWLGKSRDIDPYDELIPVLEKLLMEVKGTLTIIFNQLEYINSSTVVPIIKFLKSADEKNIKTQLYYNTAISWQKSMFTAVNNLTKIFKNLSVKAEDV